MLTKQIRQILAIIALILFISPILLIIIHLLGSHILNSWQIQYRDWLNSWQTQPHVMAASTRYHLNAWILGIVGSINRSVLCGVKPDPSDRQYHTNMISFIYDIGDCFSQRI